MRKLAVRALCAVTIAFPLSGMAQSAKEKCLKVVQANLAACQKKLPPNIVAKDPQKPTDAEKKAMVKYSKASTECNTKGSEDALACK